MKGGGGRFCEGVPQWAVVVDVVVWRGGWGGKMNRGCEGSAAVGGGR